MKVFVSLFVNWIDERTCATVCMGSGDDCPGANF